MQTPKDIEWDPIIYSYQSTVPSPKSTNNQRDGPMQYIPYESETVNYEPNTLADGMPSESPATPTEDQNVEGMITHQKISLTNDFEQAGQRYRSLNKIDQDHQVQNN